MTVDDLLKEKALLYLQTHAIIALVAYTVGMVFCALAAHLSYIKNGVLFIACLYVLLLITTVIRIKHRKYIKTTKHRLYFGMAINIFDSVAISSTLCFVTEITTSMGVLICAINLMITTGSPMTTIGFKPLLWSFSIPMITIQVTVTYFAYLGTGSNSYLLISILTFLSFFVINNFGRAAKEAQTALLYAKQEVDRAIKSKTRFFTASTHDLKQPLAALGAFLTSAVNTCTQKEVATYLEHSVAAMDMIEKQLEPMAELARIDSGKLTINKSVFDLTGSIKAMFYVHENRTGYEVVLVDRVADIPRPIQNDEHLVHRIISNIIDNSIKYTEKGTISISIRNYADIYELSIKDTGIGISEQNKKMIFDEFYQVDTGHGKGFGLGLSIVLRLCENLDIGITIDSEVGKYTNVSLIFKANQYTLMDS